MVNVGQPNPFDFSDFGPPSPSGPDPAASRAGGSSGSAAAGRWRLLHRLRSVGESTEDTAARRDRSGQDAFGEATTTGTLATAGPPLKWFGVALVLAVAGVVLALISATSGGGVLATALAGWLLAGPLAIGALAVYTRVDTRRRSESIYSAPRWAATLYWAVLAVCLIGIALGAWQIALWAGRQ